MIRKIITIDESKCNGCGLCAKACHEGAIGMVDGVAKLLREDYCDGLGDCLPACPMNAISFEEREAPPYNESAVLAAKKKNHSPAPDLARNMESKLQNFPIQIKLAPVNAPWFDGCDLLIAADCTAYAFADFHNQFMQGKVTLIACPKLDAVNYTEKLSQIFAKNHIRSITLTRMTVPCCGGLAFAVKNAIAMSGKDIPLSIATISPGGEVQYS